jgi:hypothetical protein
MATNKSSKEKGVANIMSKKPDENANIPHDQIMDAFKKLGYNENGLKDAARRLSWVPPLAYDMIEYVKIGAPGFDPYTGTVPPMLLRPLSDGFTVAMLIVEYLMKPSGAFLMGAALITHHDEAILMIEKMISEGVSIRQPDGTYVNMDVPAASRYPICSMCGTKLVRKANNCPGCGSPLTP